MGKIKSAYHYFIDRLYELRICAKEFFAESKLDKSAYEAHFKSRLLVDVHSVEKGIGLRNAKPGHSGEVVNGILDKLFIYMSRGYDINDFSFRETFRVIAAYIDFQKQFNISGFKIFSQIEKKYNRIVEKLGADYVDNVMSSLHAGAYYLDKSVVEAGKEFDFEGFIKSRHSIRSFSDEAVSSEDIKRAVSVANQCPSACNRQPSKVYFTSAKEKVDAVDKLITGSSGFKGETPNYIVLTTDRAAFSKEEQFQWYINGGIYLSYLSLALHSLGIGHCIMQWKAFYKTEEELKGIFGISTHESIIAIVGCGYYSSEVKCICAQRQAEGDALQIVE